MKEKHICPICGQGALQARTYGRYMQHKGVNISVDGLQCDYCSDCGTEIASPEQLDLNAKIIRDAFIVEREHIKREQNLLTGAEVRRIREYLGITQKIASKLFGGGPTAFAKYEAEDVVQSAGMDKLMRLAAEVPAATEWLFKYAGISTRHNQVQITSHDFTFKMPPSINQQTLLKNLFVEDSGVKSGKFMEWGSPAISSSNEGAYADVA
jgi:HTH-type transcriptional regulator / antitoxin MqsA